MTWILRSVENEFCPYYELAPFGAALLNQVQRKARELAPRFAPAGEANKAEYCTNLGLADIVTSMASPDALTASVNRDMDRFRVLMCVPMIARLTALERANGGRPIVIKSDRPMKPWSDDMWSR